MRWTVEGADKQTGFDRKISVEAATREAAETEARNEGLLISEIHPEYDSIAPPSKEQPFSVSYLASPVPMQSSVPHYFGLKLASSILIVFAVVEYLAAIFLFLSAISAIATLSAAPTAGFGGVAAIPMLAMAVAVGAAGALLHGISTGCMARRDIAQNSFRNNS